MTGEQFIEKVREIKEISSVEWDVKGDYLNADEVRVKVVADNGEYNLLLGSPALHDKVETLLQDSWVERVSFILLVNKLMELQGRSERFDVNCDLNITDVVKFAIRCTRKKLHYKMAVFKYQNARNGIKTKAFYIRFCREKVPET